MHVDTRAIERAVEHRPWPLPAGSWVMFQSWQRLLFAHWRVAVGTMQAVVPSPLVVEEFDGSAWLGLTPFEVRGLRARGMPEVPGLSRFPELNVRTYVRDADRPGIFFFTLEAASLAAVAAARALFRLPYHHARMRIAQDGDWIDYRSARTASDAEFIGRYRPAGEVFEPAPGTLAHFLTERYALHTVLRNGRVLSAEIHHRPWPLQPAEAHITRNTVLAAHGLNVEGAPLLHYAARQDTLIWGPQLSARE